MPFPEICVNDKQHRPQEWPTFKFDLNTPGTQTVTLHQGEQPLEIDKATTKAVFSARSTADKLPHFIKDMVIVDCDKGEVQLIIEVDDLPCQGLFLAQIKLQDITTSARTALYRAYLEVAPDIMDEDSYLTGVTIEEVRLGLRDISPQDNFLLDDVEFTDTEIMWAMRRPVLLWNETTPYLRRYTYTPSAFPFKYTWLNAIKAELYILAAGAYMRNSLPYSAGGLSVNDKDKYQQYAAEGKQGILTSASASTPRTLKPSGAEDLGE